MTDFEPDLSALHSLRQRLTAAENANDAETFVDDSAEVCSLGDVAFDRGTFSFTFEWKDGRKKAVIEAGKYLWMYSRDVAGAWRVWRAIVSLDQRHDEE